MARHNELRDRVADLYCKGFMTLHMRNDTTHICRPRVTKSKGSTRRVKNLSIKNLVKGYGTEGQPSDL